MPAAGAVDLATVEQLRLSLFRLSRRLRKRSQTGLTPSQQSAMSVIERHGPVRLNRLGELEQITKSSVTRLVAKLEERGLIARMPDPDDGRSRQVALTPAGRRLMEESAHRADRYLADQIATLPAGDQRRILEVVPVLQRLLG
ncbi:MAG TPA: MarR family transcriptional regulator [Jiangellaceae bacterium]